MTSRPRYPYFFLIICPDGNPLGSPVELITRLPAIGGMALTPTVTTVTTVTVTTVTVTTVTMTTVTVTTVTVTTAVKTAVLTAV